MGNCIESKLVFDTKTLERIVADPHSILKNEKSFWKNERSQRLTELWAKQVHYSISYDKWRTEISEWAEIPPDKRKNHVFMKISERIIKGKEEFIKKALPHICSYLPEDAHLDVTIRFTAFIPSRAFAHQDIVINVAAPYWKNNADNILNVLVHEIFHAGYGYCRDIRTEERLNNETLYRILDNLHNEGICTYVAYKALPIFPAPDEKDYKLLDNTSDVKRRLRDVNELISKVDSLSGKELQKLVWDKCVMERGYYIVGAHMCRVVEEKRGKEEMIETLTKGPVSFVQLYNSLVEENMKVQAELK